MSWRGVLTLLLLVGAIVSGWSVWKQRIEHDPAKTDSARSDYVLRDFEMIVLDHQGMESFTLRAPELARSPGDRTLTLSTPLFLLPDKHGQHWEVRSWTGWVSAEGDEIRLRGNVRTTSPEQDPTPVAMNTEQLNVFPESNRMTSPVVVTITQPGSILQGQGLEADLDSKRYRLLSQVHARYAPSSRR